MIQSALASRFNVGADTDGSTYFGMVASHAHHVVGTYTIYDTSGNVVANLIRVRNPWNMDYYSGPWCDGDSRWTAAYEAQVPYANNWYDGYFFMDANSFQEAFYYV
jgi:hypothetical protein